MKVLKSLLFSLFVYSNIFALDEIQPLTERWTPYQIEKEDGLSGISVDLVKEIQKRIGNTKEIKVFSWNRGYNITLKKEGYALFLTTRSQKREELFKWVGPISSMKLVFFKNAFRKDLQINSLEDAKKVKSIVVAQKTISHEKLLEYGFENLEVNSLANYSLKKLQENKTDLYPVEYHAFTYKLKEMGLAHKIVPVKMKEPIYESQLYIAFNKNTDDKIISKWQKALDNIKEDGTYEDILNKYK
ncbi:MAG: transporter substrate-binding domain-containing protein [Campylobacterota bacterium]|nr:transporter substrate-binding domain-containing protein [Campylobacterota bacterium]